MLLSCVPHITLQTMFIYLPPVNPRCHHINLSPCWRDTVGTRLSDDPLILSWSLNRSPKWGQHNDWFCPCHCCGPALPQLPVIICNKRQKQRNKQDSQGTCSIDKTVSLPITLIQDFHFTIHSVQIPCLCLLLIQFLGCYDLHLPSRWFGLTVPRPSQIQIGVQCVLV